MLAIACSTSPVSRLTSGVEFNFTSDTHIWNLSPGQRVLLVKVSVAFLSRYPKPTNIAGEFLGSLPTETIADYGGPLQADLRFKDAEDTWRRWPTDSVFRWSGRGEHAARQARDRGSWRLSAKTGGSPGQLDPGRLICRAF